MARKNPLDTIKDAAIDTIRKPKATAEKVVDQVVEGAKGGVGLGMTVAGHVATKATDTVTSLIPGRKTPTLHPAPDLEPAQPAAASRKSQGDPMSPTHEKAAKVSISPNKPVNVTKELGLDAAPVAKAAPAAPAAKPVTAIDAAADPTEVDVTPADIAPAVKKAPAKKTAAKKAPAKKTPAKKTATSTPGDKLPPRTT